MRAITVYIWTSIFQIHSGRPFTYFVTDPKKKKFKSNEMTMFVTTEHIQNSMGINRKTLSAERECEDERQREKTF